MVGGGVSVPYSLHDKTPARLVDEPIEIRQPDRGDDVSGKARAFDEQSPRAKACRRKSRCDARAATAAHDGIGTDTSAH